MVSYGTGSRGYTSVVVCARPMDTFVVTCCRVDSGREDGDVQVRKREGGVARGRAGRGGERGRGRKVLDATGTVTARTRGVRGDPRPLLSGRVD